MSFGTQATSSTSPRREELEQVDGRPDEAEVPTQLIQDLVKMLKLVSDETRLRILFYLSQNKELHVRALCDLLSQSQPAVSHHLAMLRVAGVVERRRDGKHNFYRVVSGQFEQLLSMVFDAMGDGDQRIHFNDYEISFRPPVRPK